jgi:hypothetical protein
VSWQRDLAGRAGRAAARGFADAVVSDPAAAARAYTVDPDWRRVDEQGYAARLGPRQTIAPTSVTGRWKGVDARRPNDGWRSVWKVAGLGLWVGTVAAGWWLGASKGRGPMASVRELDHLGEAFDALGGGGPGGGAFGDGGPGRD